MKCEDCLYEKICYRREVCNDIEEQIKELGCIDFIARADVQEIKHGKWIESEDDYYGFYIIKCSLCREEWCFEVEDDVKSMNYNYCPNCGAKMDGGNNNA